jgi:hypothetical protein
MKCFDSTKEKYSHFFKVVTLLIIFLHMHCQEFMFEVIGGHQNDLVKHGQDGNCLLQI